ncbi:hypothetical protein QQ045_000533 [Rhodiola kirilowii]
MEFEFISDVSIKPAYPTLSHLRNLKLSSLDQLVSFPYASIVFFYSCDDQLDLTQKLKLLKTLLSQILPKFYTLASQIKDGLTINWNDEGVRYIEAQVNFNLNNVLHKPELLSINPVDPSVLDDSRVANV